MGRGVEGATNRLKAHSGSGAAPQQVHGLSPTLECCSRAGGILQVSDFS